MKVEFISFSKRPEAFIEDPSFRYRCQNLSLTLIKHGIPSTMQHIDSFTPSQDTTHVVFHRPRYSIRFRRLMKKLQLANIIAIADFDDLVFDKEYLEFSPAVLNKVLPRRKVAKTYRLHFEALTYFDHVSVSTTSLTKYIRKLLPNAKINVLHNTTHSDWACKQPLIASPRPKTITYFPGTRSHDRDFWQIEDAVALFLKKNPSANLLVVGPLASKLLSKSNNQIKHIQKLPFKDYIQVVSNSWVNLLPLEATPFNQCKSAIKVIEAATYHAPTICSPLPDALRFEGVGATIAIDQQQWIDKLEQMMDDSFYQKTVTQIQNNFLLTTNTKIMADQFQKSYALGSEQTD